MPRSGARVGAGRLRTGRRRWSGSWQFSHDELGRIRTQTDPNGEKATYSWNADDTLGTKVLKTSANGPVSEWQYTYDAAYRMTSQRMPAAGNRAASTGAGVFAEYVHEYDAAGRQTAFTDQDGRKPITWDLDGNRLAYDGKTWSYRVDGSVDIGEGNQHTYFPWGGLKSDGCKSYVYDARDRMAEVSGVGRCGPQKPSKYTYDALDRQRSHAENGKAAIGINYDGLTSRVAVDKPTATAGLSQYVLDAIGNYVGVSATAFQFLHDDGHSNISTVTSTTDPPLVACTVRYDPWGDPEGDTAADTNNGVCSSGTTPSDAFYRSARNDQSTGTYQFGSRTYDPSKAAFLTPDATKGASVPVDVSIGVDPLTRNRYGYVNGDPLNLVDPSGHDPGRSSDMSNVPDRPSDEIPGLRGVKKPKGWDTWSTKKKKDWIHKNWTTKTIKLGPSPWSPFELLKTAGQATLGVAEGLAQTGQQVAEMAIDPVGTIVETVETAVEAYREGGGGLGGAVDAFNKTLNPAYQAMESFAGMVDAANTGDVRGAGRHGAHFAVASTGTVGVAGGLAGRVPGIQTRAAYVRDVARISDEVTAWKKAGADPEFVAREAWANRRAIGIQYKELTPRPFRYIATKRNIKNYGGDPYGPTIEWLRAKGRTWEQITDSATRTGGKDLGL